MIFDQISISADGRFNTQRLSRRVVIIEALGQDWYGWGNYTETSPAFIAYFGVRNKETALNVADTIQFLCSPESVEIRKRRDNRTGWPFELKIRGLERRHLDELLGICNAQEDMELSKAS
jgi:hypothetical protein